jgi:hypothetical protein
MQLLHPVADGDVDASSCRARLLGDGVGDCVPVEVGDLLLERDDLPAAPISGDIESKWTWVFSVDTFTVLAGTALMPSDRLRTPPAALNPFTCGV